jgi:hypothetical protein
MDTNTNEVGNNKARPIARLIAAAFCLFLMLISFALVNINTQAANAHQVAKYSSLIPADTGTPTDTPTPTPTDTPTPTNTPTPTPTPTKTPTHTPTPTPKPTTPPTATPTTAPGVTPTATTAKPTATAHAATTPTSTSSDQTPTPISGVPTTTTNNSNNGGSNNTPTTPTGGGFSIPFGSITMGLLGILGLASALFIGFVVFRKYLLPTPPPQASLPPSGAQPWRRVRMGSLNGIADVQSAQSVQNDWDNWLSRVGYAGAIQERSSLPQGGAPTLATNNGYNITNNNSSPSAATYPGSSIPPYSQSPYTPGTSVYPNTAFSSPNNVVSPNNNAFAPISTPPNAGASPYTAFSNYPNDNIHQSTSSSVSSAPNIANPQGRPFTPPTNNNGFAQPSTAEQQHFSSGVFPLQRINTASDFHPQTAIANAEPVTEQVKLPTRQITRPIRLKNIQNPTP